MAVAAAGLTMSLARDVAPAVAKVSDPVSRWSGEGDANDAVDANHGTAHSGVSFTAGMIGQAFNFDGSSDAFIELPNSTNLFPTIPPSGLTIDAWIKPNFSAENALETVLVKRDGCSAADISYILNIIKAEPGGGGHAGRPIGQITFGISDTFGANIIADSGTAVVPDDGQFHHVAGTYDGSTMKAYLDGQLVGATARSGPLVATTSAPLIGHHGGSCGQRTNAIMDEIEFYDRALTATEIAKTSVKKPKSEKPEAGLVAHWKFDEGTGSTASDSSRNGNDASLFGPTWTSSAAPLKGTNAFALDFDGVDDYADAAYDPALDLGTTGFTVALWVKADPIQADGYAGLLDKCHSCGGGWTMSIFPAGAGVHPGMNREPNAGEIAINMIGVTGPHVGTVDSVLDNVFHHVAATWDGTSLKMYLDGVLKETVPSTDPPVANTADLRIGGHFCCGRPLNGVLDDVRVYATALTSREIISLAK